MVEMKSVTVAEAYLELLSLRGVDYFFGNPGTDFVSIVDAFAIRDRAGKKTPRPLTVPHETPLMSMAYGYYQVTGRVQAAMVHVGVGTANGMGVLMAASRSNIPILFSAGRTPVTEEGDPGSRSGFIHWPQESFDQASMLREYVKWDYELRTPSQLETVVDRALTLAQAKPCGPVYLILPREILATKLPAVKFREKLRYDIPRIYPDPEKITSAADYLLNARFPLIITSSIGRSREAVLSLMELAERNALGVVSREPEYMNLPTDHLCHLGFFPDPYLEVADVIMVLDCDVPWMPNFKKPQSSAIIIQAGIDPLYGRYPIRGFPSDLTLQGEPDLIIKGIKNAMISRGFRNGPILEQRKKKLSQIHDRIITKLQENALNCAKDVPIGREWLSFNLNKFLDSNSIVVNEYDNAMRPYSHGTVGSYFGTPHAGYLGLAFGEALGVKLASPDKTVIATVGEGSYMFSVPSACHHVSAAYGLPILIVLYNNGKYNAVKRATRGLHPDGEAVRNNCFPLCDLIPDVRYEKICEAFGGYGERVESPDQVFPALERALHAVKNEKRQALLNVIC